MQYCKPPKDIINAEYAILPEYLRQKCNEEYKIRINKAISNLRLKVINEKTEKHIIEAIGSFEREIL
jgi:hypothetical protein